MIIDLILNRKDGGRYRASDFYKDVSAYGDIGNDIASALDNGEEQDVRNSLCEYIIEYGYNMDILEFINNNKWL